MAKVEQIFISYKSEYRHLAENLRDQLTSWGYRVWLDFERIAKGDYFRHRIDEGLRQSQVVVGIATREAVLSREVMWEWDYALENARLIPLIYDDFELPYHIRGTQYIDCRSDEKTAFAELKQAIAQPVDDTPLSKTQIEPITGDNRQTMLNSVHNKWIQGVLKPTLRDNELSIPLDLAPDKVLHHVEFGDYALPDDADILTIFNDMHRQLLILGDPGAGKTILMLQLAEKLIEEARTDAGKPIPVVFNLSAWAADPKQSLDDWLIATLRSLYGTSKALATEWVNGEKLLLLLDGLDEVAEEHRNACVDAINTFRHKHQLTDMVVCSRIKDYEKLTSRLDLRGGLLLQGLTQAQIDAYLADDSYAGVREVLETDTTLQAFAKTPFLLNTMGIAYRGASRTSLTLPSSDDPYKTRRDDLIGRFVNLRFKEHHHKTYTPAKTRHYLTWLAKNMVERDQTLFEVEGLQPDWLPAHQRRLWSVFFGVLVGVLGGVLFAVLFGVLFGVLLGVLFGVGLVVVYGVSEGESIEPIEQLQLDLTKVDLKRLFRLGVVSGVVSGVFGGVLVGVLGGVLGGVVLGVLLGVLFAVLFGVVAAMFGSVLSPKSLDNKTAVNQGIKASLKNALLVGVLFGVFLGVLFDVFLGVLGGVPGGVVAGVFLGVVFGVVLGVVLGGGVPVLQHIALRTMLTRYGYAPRNYATFLNYCAHDLQILRRVGGAFVFRHRTVLEYFAEQYRAEDYPAYHAKVSRKVDSNGRG